MDTNKSKSSFEVYAVSSIRIPKRLNLSRNLHRRNSSLPAHAQEGIFDLRTIFYDVFHRPADNKFIGLGPRWLNLKKVLQPMRIRCDEKYLTFKLAEIKTICLLEVDAPSDIQDSSITLTFEFPVFGVDLKIDTTHSIESRFNHPNYRLTIATLQKNNHIEWIEDWIKWYSRLHNVQRLVLYDNGSSNKQNLIQRLKELEVDMKIVLVDWPFEYGRSPDKFAQRGAINHCRMRFAVRNGYCINADIDEYLVNKSGRCLLEYLDSTFQEEPVGSVRMRERRIPKQHPKTKNPSEITRIWDHTFYKKIQGIQPFENTKYIFQFDRIKYNSVHFAISKFTRIANLRFSWKDHLAYAISNDKFFTKKIVGLNENPRRILGIHYVPRSRLFYYHFRGLRRKPIQADGPTVEEFDPTVHKEESEIYDWCLKAGLISPRESDAE